MPALKAPFPLSPETVAVVAAALSVPEPPPASYSLDALLADVVAPSPDLRAVEVHKRRTRFQVGGCLATRAVLESTGT